MSQIMAARIAKLENRQGPDGPRSFIVAGGSPDGVTDFLRTFGVCLAASDTVDFAPTDNAGTGTAEMRLVSCSDMGVVMTYVAKYGKTLLDVVRERHAQR